MPYPKKVWVKLNRPEGEVNLRDKAGRDIGDIPEGTELTVTGIDAQGRYIVEGYIASSVVQDTDPNVPPVLDWAWPTQYRFVTQAWGNDPDFYRPYGLPGHEGIDIRAYSGSQLYAVWDGVVTRIDAGPNYGNYGYSMRIRYEWQGVIHEVIYAHGVPGSARFSVGDPVKRGDVIMLADATGNVQQGRAHLHLSLKLLGKTYVDIGPNGIVRVWPNNLHDPTPYLLPGSVPEPPRYATLPEGHALKGVHGPTDPGDWAWNEHNALDVIRECGFLAVKTLCPGASAPQISMMKSKGARFICVRLFAKLNERRGDTLQQRAEWFYNEVAQAALELYGAGVRYFEVANEVNLIDEGLGYNWDNGVEFSQWFGYVVSLLRVSMPGIKCGFPGLSPGGTIPGVRQDSTIFWQQAQQAVTQADYLNCHAYFGGDGSTWGTALAQTIAFCKANPSKVIVLSEFSDNGQADKAVKGASYAAFYSALATQTPPNLGAATVFVLKASAGFEHETLIERDGTRSAIVQALS